VVLGIDGSVAMLEMAERIACGTAPVEVALPDYGFPSLTIPSQGAGNVHFLRGDLESLPVADATADLVLSINTVDRLPHGPDRALVECSRLLRRGGQLVFTDPLNWTEVDHWRRYPGTAAVLALLPKLGLRVKTWYDHTHYNELVDARGSIEQFTTLAIHAIREREA
jgi:SAM-dependent methyltransferase